MFCDIYGSLTGSRIAYGGCYDRNDNTQDYCENYGEYDKAFCAMIEEGNEEICLDDGYEDGQNNTYDENRTEWCEFWGNEYDEGFAFGEEK